MSYFIDIPPAKGGTPGLGVVVYSRSSRRRSPRRQITYYASIMTT